MKIRILLIALVAFLVVPMTSYAKTEPKIDLEHSGLCAESGKAAANIVVASVMDDKDQPCYVGGKVAAYCSRNAPYYNVSSGDCYSDLQECKKADGDLSSVQGSGGCVRCSK